MENKKVLWICNIMLPAVARELSLPYSNREGWLSGIFERVADQKDGADFELSICFPLQKGEQMDAPELTKLVSGSVQIKGITCYGFYEDLKHPENYDPEMETRFTEIFEQAKPDMIHIFGTEFPHALAAVKSFGKPDKTLVGIQGLCYEIAQVYMAGLPDAVQNKVTFRDWLRKDSLKQQQRKFYLRGEREKEVIRNCGYLTGRTTFDRVGTSIINENAIYYKMNETMRAEFYSGEWDYDNCEKHSLFLGQGDYPLKGFHFLLKALPKILEDFPDTKVYVAGNSVIRHQSMKEKIKLPAYGTYLLSLIKQYGLQEHIVMLGNLTVEKMKKQYLKTHVFLCTSILENSPNTLAEAMLLGVPVAASEVGGIPDMLVNEQEGILFQGGNEQALADAVKKLFSLEKEDLLRLSGAERRRAWMAHDRELNYERMLEIYEHIIVGRES